MSELLRRIASFLIRISAFITKEFFSAVSQPRLLGVLVLGPFFILLIFGISYQNDFRTLRTMLVVPEDSRIEPSVKAFADLPIPGIEVIITTSNTTGALNALKEQLVDLVLVIPADIVKNINNNQHAVFTFYHQEIDPFEVAYAEIVANRITEETNRQLMLSAVEQSKEEARTVQAEIHELSEFQSLNTDDNGQDASNLATGGNSLGLLEVLGLLFQVPGASTDRLRSENLFDPQASTPVQNSAPESNDRDLALIDEQLERFVEMNTQVIVEPFRYETRSLSEVEVQPVHFYIPAVLALLMQHIAISLAGLSIVSERFAGTMELMRAAPVNAFEVMLGKYLSYLAFLGLIAAVLTALVHWGLGVPMLGNLALYTLVITLVILVSLGMGFLISNFARSDSQAIQFSMVVLLASIFFSGLFLQLYRLRWPAQTISWAMPATYGLNMLQDIMLRGIQPRAWMFGVLAALAAALFIINWLRLRKLMEQS